MLIPRPADIVTIAFDIQWPKHLIPLGTKVVVYKNLGEQVVVIYNQKLRRVDLNNIKLG